MDGLKLLPRYVINLGLINGLRLFLAVEFFRKSIIKMRGYSFPIFLRPATTDYQVFREVFLFKEYDFKTHENISIVVDAGANIGLSSVFLKGKFPQASIYAIEPDQANYEALLKNVEEYENITAINSGVWPNQIFLKIKNREIGEWAYEVEETTEEEGSIKAISIESLMKQYDLQQIDLLKLDIEGSEKELFESNFEWWLPRTKYIIIELHDWIKEGCSRSFFRTIAMYRFKLEIHKGLLLLRNLDLKN